MVPGRTEMLVIWSMLALYAVVVIGFGFVKHLV